MLRRARFSTMPKRLALLAATAIVLGCPAEPARDPDEATPAERTAHEPASDAPARETVDLLSWLDVAASDGAERAADGVVRQRAGGVIAFAVAVPDGARLRGRARRVGATDADAVVRVDVAPGPRIDAEAPPGAETSAPGHIANEIAKLAVGPGAGRESALDVDLAAFGGRFARIELRADAADGDVALDWTALEIDGLRGAPAGDVAFPRRRWNVLLVVFDSLRADRVEPYAAANARTPTFARLAREGVTFVEARSSASWTRASVASLMTSLEPEVAGVLRFEDALPADVPYLPEILRNAGYRTYSVINNGMVSRVFGFGRGFEKTAEIYEQGEIGVRPVAPDARASVVWGQLVQPFLRRGEGEPFFVYIHAIEPHSPYDAPAPYGSIDDFGYDGDVDTSTEGMRRLRNEPEAFDDEDIREIERRYRGEVAYADAYLARLVELVDRANLADSTLLVVVSDHGEEFREHDGVGHGLTVYEEQLRVPWIMRLPGVLPAGRRVEADANLVDFPATILDLLGLAPGPALRGESMLPWIAEPGAARRRASYGTSIGAESVTVGRWKLIRTPGEHGRPNLALFDLAADPGETRDLAIGEPVVVAALEQLLHRSRREGELEASRYGRRAVSRGEIDPATLENLRALGYAE